MSIGFSGLTLGTGSAILARPGGYKTRPYGFRLLAIEIFWSLAAVRLSPGFGVNLTTKRPCYIMRILLNGE